MTELLIICGGYAASLAFAVWLIIRWDDWPRWRTRRAIKRANVSPADLDWREHLLDKAASPATVGAPFYASWATCPHPSGQIETNGGRWRFCRRCGAAEGIGMAPEWHQGTP